MDDADVVDRVAAELLDRRCPGTVSYLREQAEIAAANGDRFSAEAWTDIADAAERLLQKR